jgi:zinc protease
MEALDKQIWALAYQAHPYHHSTIGWRSDIEEVSIERLQEFYNEFYWPNNATVTIAGNFNTEEVFKLIKKHFGEHPKAPKAFPRMYTQEPKQEGERRVIVKRPGASMVGIAHKIPEGNHDDVPAIVLLELILSEGKTSRLYKSLIDTTKATEEYIYTYQLYDPSLFISYATLTPDTKHEEVEKIIKQEYINIASNSVSAAELQRAKKVVRVSISEKRDGIYSLLSNINEDLATGDWTRFVTLPEKIAKVTAADIKRVAKTYLNDDTSTIGWFIDSTK